MAEQADEAAELFRYHCLAMQLFSSDFQSLVMVANSAGILMIGTVAWLSRQPWRDNGLDWPLPLILTSACSFALAMASIKTFNLQENMLNSRTLAQQSREIARDYATSVANLNDVEDERIQELKSGQKIALLLKQMDSSLSQVDRAEFVISDRLDKKEAKLIYPHMIFDRK